MSASTTDKLDRVTDSTSGRPVLAQLVTPGKAIGASSITANNLTNWTTSSKIHFAIYALTSAGVKDPTTQTDWTGIVSGNTITNLALTGGTDQVYNPGAIVDPTPTAAWAKDLYDCLLGFANQNGTLQTAAVQAALNLGNTPTAGWTPLGTTFTYSANNGNKEYVITAPIDLTSTLSVGMKVQFTRGTAPSTQCMAFASASSQYATKASPAGITFTGPYTAETWLYLQSYTGQTQYIISRADPAATTGGWWFVINSSGQLRMVYGTTSSFTDFISTQSVPLNRWTHVAAAVTSVASKTAVLYINGVVVPSTSSVSAATTLTQAAVDLRVGAAAVSTANTFFNGFMSEVRLWSVAQTQASIQANMGLNLVGNETNLIFLLKGAANFNDATSNANNLTATNGAIATQAANPFNSVEYGVITAISFAASTSTIKIFTGTDYNIPNMALSSPQYSIARTPFGFPGQHTKWMVDMVALARQSNSPAANTWVNLGHQLSLPTGDWRVFISGHMIATQAGTTNLGPFITLSNANNTRNDQTLTVGTTSVGSTNAEVDAGFYKEGNLSLSAQTIYYLNVQTAAASATVYIGDSSTPNEATLIRAICPYI